MRRTKRPTGFTAPIAAALAFLLSFVFPALLAPVEARLWDVLNRNLAAPPDARVVVVGIDDLSLQDYGRLDTWNRELYARALATLQQAGVRVVGIDVLFDTPAPGDRALATALGRAGVVLASSPQRPQGSRTWPATYGVSTLNIEGGGVNRFQTAYRSQDQRLWPSFSAQLARLAGVPRPLDTDKRILRYLSPDQRDLPLLSFRDVVNGNVRFSALQDKVVLIGVTASGVPGNTFPDSRLDPVPGVVLQARAVSSLLSPPFAPPSPWLFALICAVLAGGAALAGGFWGFGLASLGLGLSVPLYLTGWLFPGVTASLAALLGTLFVMLERIWTVRRVGSLDPLTGLGNRLAFTRAVETRWHARAARPIGLLLIDLGGFRRVNEVYGRSAGDELLRQVASSLRAERHKRNLVFRWGADEFAVLVENAEPGELIRLCQQLQLTLSELRYQDVPLRASIGQAISTPEMEQPAELAEQASRDRYRNKYRLEHE
ncbi:CHASE2 domain-containing protein [Deinococcus sp.]|uniref:CHASE2 domain-containing protein n=1 Tax=Deinococcus sp. TaxID=47478 RepID=UPI003B58DC2B